MKCEECYKRFDCFTYIVKQHYKDKKELEKLAKNSWDLNSWKSIKERYKDMQNMTAKEYVEKWEKIIIGQKGY